MEGSGEAGAALLLKVLRVIAHYYTALLLEVLRVIAPLVPFITNCCNYYYRIRLLAILMSAFTWTKSLILTLSLMSFLRKVSHL